jgi:hypothetical protein
LTSLLILIWCLIPIVQCLGAGTDRQVVTFFNRLDAVRSPGILRTVQVTNGFSEVKQYGRLLVLWFTHPGTPGQGKLLVIEE